MPSVFQVLSPSDAAEVFAFASERLRAQILDETERRFRSWDVAWRSESLEHYLRLGWSFIARDRQVGVEQAVGFFLAQPFLFFRGQTQTLWVEHVEAATSSVAEELVDVAVKLAREKHLQRVLFAEGAQVRETLKKWKAVPLADGITEVKTVK